MAADDRSCEFYATIILFLGLTWATFPMRIWVRARMLKTLGLGDVLTTCTMVRSRYSMSIKGRTLIEIQALNSVFGAWVIYAIHHGAGRHNHDVQPKNIIQAMKVDSERSLSQVLKLTTTGLAYCRNI